jgi:hypothetical protein
MSCHVSPPRIGLWIQGLRKIRRLVLQALPSVAEGRPYCSRIVCLQMHYIGFGIAVAFSLLLVSFELVVGGYRFTSTIGAGTEAVLLGWMLGTIRIRAVLFCT